MTRHARFVWFACLLGAACASVPRAPEPLPPPLAGWWKLAGPKGDRERALAFSFGAGEMIFRTGACVMRRPAVLFFTDGRVFKVTLWRSGDRSENLTFSREPDGNLLSVDGRGEKVLFSPVSGEGAAALEEIFARPPPGGWWIARSSQPEGAPSAWRFTLEELDISAGGRQPLRDAPACLSSSDGRVWKRGNPVPGGPETGAALTRETDGTLVYAPGAGMPLVLAPAPAEESAALDGALRVQAEEDALCPRAERCCLAGMKLLGAACDVPSEFAAPSLESCRKLAARVRERLEGSKEPVPADCR